MDCGSDAHAHVLHCPLNPNKGSYYINTVALNKIHSKMRTQKLKDFLETYVTDSKVRGVVARSLCKNLIDLNMDPNEFIQGDFESNQVEVEAQSFVQQIQENILNLSCPRCKTVFLDFEQCAAVTCKNCNCSFCGICLQDCGIDSHGHVILRCTFNPNPGQVFIDSEDLKIAQNIMRTAKLKAFLYRNLMDLEVRAIVIRNLYKDLIDLGMDPEEFKLV